MKHTMHVAIALLVLVLAGLQALSWAGTTGKVAGTVKDKSTGNPLPGVNVILEGTTMGAATDNEGYYFIINIPPGKYNVRATMIGYSAVVKREVQVTVDYTTRVDFDLEPAVLEGQVVVVTAERPLIERDMTATASVTTGEQIDKMPVNTYQQVLATHPGFVESGTGLNREFNVRGGRSGELAYLIDGFYVEDPQVGGMGSGVANVGIAELAVMTGTFNAEYGEAMSGVLNIVTKEGGPNYSGRVRFRTDKGVNPREITYLRKYQRIVDGQRTDWITSDGQPISAAGTAPASPGGNKMDPRYWETVTKKIYDYDTYRVDAYVGGPIPFLGKANTFFVSGDYLDTETYLGWTGMPYRFESRGNAKLVFKPLESIKLTIGGVVGRSQFKNYSHGYKYIPDALETNYEDNYMVNFTITHTLSPRTFYTLRGSQFVTNYWYKGLEEEEFFVYKSKNTGKTYVGREYAKYYQLSDSLEYAGKANRTRPDEEYEFNKGWWTYQYDESGAKIDSTWTIGGNNDFEERKNTISTLKFDITSQATKTHQFKAGVEVKQLDLRYFYVGAPYSPKPEYYHYAHKPLEGAAYLQDKMEFEDWGLVVNAGLRVDYMDTKAKYFGDPTKPTTAELRDAEKKIHISPRLGFAHPVTDRAVLHFAYGHFYQVPDYQYLYYFENQDDPNYPYPDLSIYGIYSWVGNANLKPEKTIAYELGVQTRLSRDVALDVTVYYKDIFDYTALQRFMATPTSYWRYVNMDYANAKGVEVSLEKRFSNFFGGTLNYTYSRAEGNAANVSSHYNDWYSFSVFKTYPPKKTVTMDWDQTHTMNFVLDFGKPGNWALNVVGNYGSGLPYTPVSSRGLRLDEPNSARRPWTMTVNLRGQKIFRLMGMELTLYADVNNLFNKRNVLYVYGDTGKPDASSDWDETQDFVSRPQYLGPPRTLELGLSVGF